MFSLVPFSVLSAAFPAALAQGSGSTSGYVAGLVDHLNGLGYTGAANAISMANSTTSGQQWLSELPNGNYTAFVPDNDAIQNLSMSVSGNNELLAQYLSYHFVHGDFLNSTANSTSGGGGGAGGGGGMTSTTSQSSQSSSASGGSSSSPSSSSGGSSSSSATATLIEWYRRQSNGTGSSDGQPMVPALMSGLYPNDTIGRTLLNSSNLVMLEGNKSQVLAWSRLEDTANVTILNQANINVTNSTTYQNLFINTIDGVLQPPGNLTQALSAVNATSFLSLAQQANLTGASGNNVTVLDALSMLTGFTLFIPTNDAIQNASTTLSGLQSNETAIMALLGNHVINGTSLYQPDFQNATASGMAANFTSAAGEPIFLAPNGTGGLLVQNQNGSSAAIVRPDVLVANGVFHIIDNVLVETDSNPAQASSAVLSASSAAAQSSTDTLPIGGGFATPTSGGMSQSESSSASSSSESSGSSSPSSSGSSSSPAAGGSATAVRRALKNESSRLSGSPLIVTLFGATVWIFGF